MKINTQALTTLTIEAILDGMREAIISEQAIAQLELETLNACCVFKDHAGFRCRGFTAAEKEDARRLIAQQMLLSGMLRDIASAAAAALQGRLKSIDFNVSRA